GERQLTTLFEWLMERQRSRGQGGEPEPDQGRQRLPANAHDSGGEKHAPCRQDELHVALGEKMRAVLSGDVRERDQGKRAAPEERCGAALRAAEERKRDQKECRHRQHLVAERVALQKLREVVQVRWLAPVRFLIPSKLDQE